MYTNLAKVSDSYSGHRRHVPKSQARAWYGYTEPVTRTTDASASYAVTLTINDLASDWFKSWAAKWAHDTAHLSSMSSRTQHPAYKQIVGLGTIAIPLLLGDLAEGQESWFAALREITGEDPVTDHMRGKFNEMRSAWIEWARKKNITPRNVRRNPLP